MKDIFTLYLKDKPLIDFSLQKSYLFIHKENIRLLPLQLRDIAELNTEDGRDSLKDWLSIRAVPLDRENAKYLLNAMGLPQGRPLVIVIESKALSLNDCYWIKSEKEDITWKDINLYNNSFSKALSDIAILGRASKFTIQNRLLTPETTTQGTYAKCWVRENDGIYLYKINYRSKESEAEYISSIIADKLELNHVHYDLTTYENRVCCKCKNMCDENNSIVPIIEYLSYIKRNPTSIVDWVVILPTEWHTDFYKMLVFDCLIGNSDRHLNNWGILYDPNTGNFKGLHPLFDHNCAIDITDTNFLNTNLPSMINNTQLEAGIYSFKNLPDSFKTKVFNLQEWYYTREAKVLFKKVYGRTHELDYLKNLITNITGKEIKKSILGITRW